MTARIAGCGHVAIRIVRRLTLCAVVGIVALVGLLSFDHHRETTLPTPTGPFAVGRATYVWRDAAHADIMAPTPSVRRALLAWIWYPAAIRQSPQAVADYVPAPWRTALARQSGVLISQFLTRDVSRVHAHSVRDAALSLRQRAYPVVLMRAGLAALTVESTSLAEDLASHGYVVVGFDAPHRSFVVVFPDGRTVARAPQNDADRVGGPQQEQLATRLVYAWSADMDFALDQLERLNAADSPGRFRGRLDLQRVGVFGHSLGGATVLQFCHDDLRCKAGIDVDGAPLGNVVREGVTQPFLFLESDHRGEPVAETRQVEAKIHAIFDRLPRDRRLARMIPGANHYMFSDHGAMLMSPLVMSALRVLGLVGLDGRRQIAVTAQCISGFFDVYLNGAPAAALHDCLAATRAWRLSAAKE